MPTNPADTTSTHPSPDLLPGIRTVMVPLDGSPLAERALAPAAWLAGRLHAELHVVVADVARDERWWFERYLEHCLADHPGTTAHRTDDQDIARAVRDMAEGVGPSVVCAATHGRGRTAGLTGSTFLSFVRSRSAPVVAVGPSATIPVGKGLPVVVCVDGTPASEAAVAPAAAWARRLGLHLTVLTVGSIGVHPIGPDVTTGRSAFGPTDPDAYVDAILHRPELAGLSVDFEVLWDLTSPHKAILQRLHRRPASLVAVASHARTGISRLVLGSEAAGIVHGSPVPVLVHPTLHPPVEPRR
jgi:nucleotide-binding universal stress UspA family protein